VTGQDPYAYPGSEVLKNLPGLRDAAALQRFEYQRTAVRNLELQATPIRGRYDLAHLKAIHKHLFQDVDVWAGDLRTVSISKAESRFAMPELIQGYSTKVFAAIATDDFLRGLEPRAFADRLAHHFGEINAVHPFREGNGRATRAFLSQLAIDAGHRLDYSCTSTDAWIEASRASFFGDVKPASDLFAAIATAAAAVKPNAQDAAPPSAGIREVFERALDAKSVPESIRPQLFNQELELRTSRGELPSDSPGRARDLRVSDPTEVTKGPTPRR
jgi:cell filamentation protein